MGPYRSPEGRQVTFIQASVQEAKGKAHAMTNLYKVLGLSPSATTDEIKSAWRKVARETHPDRNTGKRKQFEQAKEAYEVLSDPAQRRIYDLMLKGKNQVTCRRCGKAKLPQYKVCFMCAMALQHQSAGTPTFAAGGKRPQPYGSDTPRQSADEIVADMLGADAIRHASRGVGPVDLNITIGPDLKVNLKGGTVSLFRDIQTQLNGAQRIINRVRKWVK